MTLPNLKLDWTINISSFISTLSFLGMCVVGWYNLKQEVAVNKATSDVKFSQIDASFSEVKAELLNNTLDIKSDIRDLRSDLRVANSTAVVSPKR